MSGLLKEIKSINAEAASKLEEADIRTDAELHLLTPQDLQELFPRPEKIKLRKTVFEIIHKRKPINVLLKELKGFIPHESFKAALTNNGVLVDYLHILRDMKTQMNNVQTFLDAHVGLLEQISKTQADQEPDKDSLSAASNSSACSPVEPYNSQADGHQQGADDSSPDTSGQMIPRNSQTGLRPQRLAITYRSVVSGQTFDAHQRLLEKVEAQAQNQFQLKACKGNEDSQITIVFCPISSRVMTDVEAALTKVTDEHVILVLMHHAYEVKHVSSLRSWPKGKNVVLQVNVFYHETVPGLLRCQENDDAVSQIKIKLLQYRTPIGNNCSGDGQGVIAESSSNTGSTPGGGRNWGSFSKFSFPWDDNSNSWSTGQ